jgi:hypothetical protein
VLGQRCKSLPQPPAPCSGSISLEVSPNPAYKPGQVTYKVTGLSNCKDKTIVIGLGSCNNQIASCKSEDTGCTFTDNVPSILVEGNTYTLYACIDKNGDGDFSDEGETATQSFSISIKECTGEGDIKISKECCPGLITFQLRCLNASKFKCRDNTLYYEGTDLEWNCGGYNYCCEDKQLCNGMSACCSSKPCSTTSTTTTTISSRKCRNDLEGCSSNNECCEGLVCHPTLYQCVSPSQFSCENGEGKSHRLVYKNGMAKVTVWDYCCEGSDDCGTFSACEKSQPCVSLPSSTTTTTILSARCIDVGGMCRKTSECHSLGGYCYPEGKLNCKECCCIGGGLTPEARAIQSISISLKTGWNLISFPFVSYTISQMKDVYSYVYIYNPLTFSYEQIDITKASGKGFWAFASKDATIEIMGTQALYPENISLMANKPNLIPIPKDGLKVISQKGNCKITKFYYFNSTDQTWYKWDAMNGEYSRFNSDKKAYEVVKIDADPFIPEGLAIFLYTENDCRLSS